MMQSGSWRLIVVCVATTLGAGQRLAADEFREIRSGGEAAAVSESKPQNGPVRSVRTYAVGDLIQSLQRSRGLTVEEARFELRLNTKAIVGQQTWSPKGGNAIDWHQDRLVIRQTAQMHAQIAELLDVWRRTGFGMFKIDITIWQLPRKALDGLDVEWKVLRSDATVRAIPQPNVANLSAPLETPLKPRSDKTGIVGQLVTTRNLPVFCEPASAEKCHRLSRALQTLQSAKKLSFPKVTLYNGQTASLSSAVGRPFVVDFQDRKTGGKPVIDVVTEGLHVRLRPVAAAGDALRLDCELTHTKLLSVRTATIGHTADGKPLQVQIPEVRTIRLTTSAGLKGGQRLLIGGFTVDDGPQRDGETAWTSGRLSKAAGVLEAAFKKSRVPEPRVMLLLIDVRPVPVARKRPSVVPAPLGN